MSDLSPIGGHGRHQQHKQQAPWKWGRWQWFPGSPSLRAAFGRASSVGPMSCTAPGQRGFAVTLDLGMARRRACGHDKTHTVCSRAVAAIMSGAGERFLLRRDVISCHVTQSRGAP